MTNARRHGMRAARRCLTLALGLLVIWLAAASPAWAAPVAADNARPMAAPAAQLSAPAPQLSDAAPQLSDTAPLRDLSSCLASNKVGDLVLLIDTSGSLKDSDPTAVRVAAAEALVTRLAASFAKIGANVDVSVA
ncbi:MAG: hypothetical protein ABJD68_08975, partial [Nakamurella sp.]